MPSDWANLDLLSANFDDFLKEFMENVANAGEGYIKGGGSGVAFGGGLGVGSVHAKWFNDTGSLLASVTGYEATIGNPYANFGDARWERAQAYGSDQYPYNTPEHYDPDEGADIDTSDADATAILSVWTKYPLDGREKDDWLRELVEETLNEAADFMAGSIPALLTEALRNDPTIPISKD